jgi:hypothetical protein
MSRQTIATRGAVACLVLASTGCVANLDSIHRTDSLPKDVTAGKGTAVIIDAKQRTILSETKTLPATSDGSGAVVAAFCAEPSPDALSALSANANGNFSQKDALTLSGNAALTEQAEELGVRTTTIQLMRDIMYRECEAYLSGAIHDVTFMTAHRRLQSSMVAILAIEQLTGPSNGENHVLSPQTPAPPSGDSPTPKVDDPKQPVAKVPAASPPAPPAKTPVPAAPPAQPPNPSPARTSTVVAAAQPDHPAQPAAKPALVPASASSAASAPAPAEIAKKVTPKNKQAPANTDQSAPTGPTDAQAKIYNAYIVDDIVRQTLNLSFARELCTSVLESPKVIDGTTASIEADPIGKDCLHYLEISVTAAEKEAQEEVALQDAMTKYYTAAAKNLDKLTKSGKAGTLPPVPDTSGNRQPPSPVPAAAAPAAPQVVYPPLLPPSNGPGTLEARPSNCPVQNQTKDSHGHWVCAS